jgi:hypothetical protein
MPIEKQARLEALSGWVWGQREESWEFGFFRLSEYAAENGNCKVSSRHELQDGFRLGRWVGHQRQIRESMPPESQARLEALSGWSWDTPRKSWEFGFVRLSEFAAEHGNCMVSSRHELQDGFRLGRWVRTQRQIRESMPPERRTQLEALPGWTWDVSK